MGTCSITITTGIRYNYKMYLYSRLGRRMSTANVTLNIVDNVHIFTFHNSSRRAAKEYVNMGGIKLREWIDAYDKTPFPVILDISKSGLFSVSYVKELTQKDFESLPFLPEIHLAYVTDKPHDIMVINTLNPMAANHLNNTRRVFSPKEMDKAIEWLSGAKAS